MGGLPLGIYLFAFVQSSPAEGYTLPPGPGCQKVSYRLELL